VTRAANATAELDSGEAWTYTCSYTVTQADLDAGRVLNTVTAEGRYEGGDPATDTDDETVDGVIPPLSITVDKTANANGDNAYSEDETGAAGASVGFRVIVTNNSTVDVVIDSISDVWPGGAPIAPCSNLLGVTVPAGGSVTCEFTVASYVPASDAGAKVNTATVKVHQLGNPHNTTSVDDPSTVRGAAAQVLGEEINKAPNLPRTGRDDHNLVSLGLLLLGVGSIVLLTLTLRPDDRRSTKGD
jgi:hypothetical protein